LIAKSKETNDPEKSAVLVLEDGTLVKGIGFGASKKVYGEVVFNTGMVGYPESITDPSYNGQILMQTYPLIGNYGVQPAHFESEAPKIEGYVVHELCREPSHTASKTTLDEWLTECGVPGIEAVDTRKLTKKIRVKGVMLGILETYERRAEPDFERLLEEAKRIPDPYGQDLVGEVTVRKTERLDVNGDVDIVLIDCGAKRNIIRNLLTRKVNVIRVPYNTSVTNILEHEPEGILISNGPGDPKTCKQTIENIRELSETKIPILGICLGVQLLALALGGDTYKLKFGHRGQNHPVIDLKTNRCYITSQNHGFAVEEGSLKGTGFEVFLSNANDKTVEGLTHRSKPIKAVQFHPEASPGPNDTNYLFDWLVQKATDYGRRN